MKDQPKKGGRGEGLKDVICHTEVVDGAGVGCAEGCGEEEGLEVTDAAVVEGGGEEGPGQGVV